KQHIATGVAKAVLVGILEYRQQNAFVHLAVTVIILLVADFHAEGADAAVAVIAICAAVGAVAAAAVDQAVAVVVTAAEGVGVAVFVDSVSVTDFRAAG